MRKHLLTVILLHFSYFIASSQCVGTISTFPYNESFETGANGWVSGGVNNSWAYGTPAKAIISGAGGGTKCWISGGLTGNSYNNNERSYVTSPCFDFTNVNYPYFEAKIFWETEYDFDGATFQFSTNNGSTWTNVGSTIDAVNCLNQNWFNTTDINFLNTLASPKEGWSGSSNSPSGSCLSSNASGTWVLAKHCMSNLAGLPSVQFRFAFGAGSQCNNYNGFAFDNIFIGESPNNSASFTNNCTGLPLQYQFTNTSANCPIGFAWNFGDPASGAANTSGNQNPLHTFSSAGTYTVTLLVSGPCNAPSTTTQSIITINASAVANAPSCHNGTNGNVTVSVQNSTATNTYTLMPSGVNNSTGIFNNYATNTYTCTIVNSNNCAITTTATIANPPAIVWGNFTLLNNGCSGTQTGAINAPATGGSGVLTFGLNPTGTSNQTGNFTGLGGGQYTITASDANGCNVTSSLIITQPNTISFTSITPQNVTCVGINNGSINAIANNGVGTFNYLLSPNGVSNQTGIFQNLSSGTYTIQASDANSCSISSVVTILSNNPLLISNISISNPWCVPANNGSMFINATGGTGALTYSTDNSNFTTSPSFLNISANTYTVIVKDGNGCTSSSIVNVFEPQKPSIMFSTSNKVTCFGNQNGNMLVIAQTNGAASVLFYNLLPNAIIQSNGNFINLPSSNYSVVVTDNFGCSVTQPVNIGSPDVLEIIKVNTENPDSCGLTFKANVAVIANGGTKPYDFDLLPVNMSNATGFFNNLQVGNYTIKINDANNCATQESFTVKEQICCGNVTLPSAFSPNGDNKNDELKLLNATGIVQKEFLVFGRWGQLIFKAQNTSDSWDGTFKGIPCEMGTYYYQVKYVCILTNKEIALQGDVNLIR
jgi:gliding motility-associated-like protein